ncbi:hypothetical protein HanPI659440_Chr15g0580561 [Helianthus annuus]|nr:hypothetical protein HanPI659440_Chr15g0580551 [Helianthus annuus]KAJ0691950.1 hypothetical protein HanPI659440_Chr15g0580561 [Helianthus annuus]
MDILLLRGLSLTVHWRWASFGADENRDKRKCYEYNAYVLPAAPHQRHNHLMYHI